MIEFTSKKVPAVQVKVGDIVVDRGNRKLRTRLLKVTAVRQYAETENIYFATEPKSNGAFDFNSLIEVVSEVSA